MKSVLHLDFETFSEAPLRVCGGYRYAADSTTEILCACWAIDDNEVQTWAPSMTPEQAIEYEMPTHWFYGIHVPKELASAVSSGCTIMAHNAQFERAIWQSVVVRRHRGPATSRRQFVCTAARAASAGLPRSLENVALAVGAQQTKDKEGARLLRIFAMPRKPTKNDPRTRIYPNESHFEFIRLCQYCQQDVRTERAVDELIPPLHPNEQKLFTLDMEINERGLPIDIDLVKKTTVVVHALEQRIKHEVNRLTVSEQYPKGLNPTQGAKMLELFQSMGVELENLQADHVRKYMKLHILTLAPLARRLLLLRLEAGKSSTKKLASMLAYCTSDNRARGTLLFYGASTGRWSGKGVQPHNFIRGTLKYDEQLRILSLLAHGDHEIFEMFYEWPISNISQCMRGFITASKGKILRVVDYTAIEARVLAWMACEEYALEVYRKGLDVYKVMASKVYRVPYEEVTSEHRRIGKNLVLGCGYGLGGAKFVQYSEKAGVEIEEAFAKAAVKLYRQENKMIVRFWGDVERCAIQAVREKRTLESAVILRNLAFYVEKDWFCIQLPSGRSLRFYRPRVMPVEKFGEPALQLQYRTELRGRMYPESTYGGKLVENIIQAIARDLLVHGMFSAEAANYRVVGTVHDEILTDQDIDNGSVKHLEETVCKLPSWGEGLPINAEGFESVRYRKG